MVYSHCWIVFFKFYSKFVRWASTGGFGDVMYSWRWTTIVFYWWFDCCWKWQDEFGSRAQCRMITVQFILWDAAQDLPKANIWHFCNNQVRHLILTQKEHVFPSYRTKNTEDGAAAGSSCSQGLVKDLNKRETSLGDGHAFRVLLALTANGFKSKSKQSHLCSADIHNQVPDDRRKILDSVKIQIWLG